MNYTELTEKLVQKCLKAGAGSAEVYLESGRDLSISILNGEIETIEEASSAGIGFRVIVDGRMGFSHCNDLTEKSLDDTIARAVEFARLTTPDKYNALPGKQQIKMVEGLNDPGLTDVSMEEKIKRAIDVEKAAMADPAITKSSGSSYGEGEYEIFIANSNGVSGSYKSTGCSLGVSVVAEKGDQKNTGGSYCSRRYFSDLEPIEETAGKASKKARELLDPIMVKTQRASVIFDPSTAVSLLGGILGALNGERVLQGASFLANSLEQQFASELLSVIDDGTRPKGLGSAPFDGEGVPTQKRVLIDHGVLKGFMHNTISAKRAGTDSTGNASRRGFTSLPGIGTHNLTVLPGDSDPDEIISETSRGILLKNVTGYGINPVNGNFSGGASGLWIENGRIVHPVKGITIAGTAREMLMGIDMLGNDVDSQKSFAAPTIRIYEMQIGGK